MMTLEERKVKAQEIADLLGEDWVPIVDDGNVEGFEYCGAKNETIEVTVFFLDGEGFRASCRHNTSIRIFPTLKEAFEDLRVRLRRESWELSKDLYSLDLSIKALEVLIEENS